LSGENHTRSKRNILKINDDSICRGNALEAEGRFDELKTALDQLCAQIEEGDESVEVLEAMALLTNVASSRI
jgi:hypothetical protein